MALKNSDAFLYCTDEIQTDDSGGTGVKTGYWLQRRCNLSHIDNLDD